MWVTYVKRIEICVKTFLYHLYCYMNKDKFHKKSLTRLFFGVLKSFIRLTYTSMKGVVIFHNLED